MVKLLKYEMKKQQTSRMVIGSILLVCVLGFALGMLLGREKLAAVSLAVMMLATFFVVFYVGIESILVLNRDLKTKQSYMLWMVPKSIWEILGSKFLAAILQMLIVFVMYVAVGLICPAICVNIGTSGFNPGFVLYYLVVGFILFGVSGWMADKKLSV